MPKAGTRLPHRFKQAIHEAMGIDWQLAKLCLCFVDSVQDPQDRGLTTDLPAEPLDPALTVDVLSIRSGCGLAKHSIPMSATALDCTQRLLRSF